MKKVSRILAFLFLCIFLFSAVIQLQVLADVGNHNSYSRSSGSSTRSSSSHSYSSSGGSGGGLGVFTIPVIIIVIIVVVASKNKNGGGASVGSAVESFTAPAPIDMTQSIEAQIREKDPDFSSQKFLSWSEEVFMTLQDAWTKRDWKIIRPFECEALFNKHSRQLDEYIRNNTINVVERICINKSMLTNYSLDNQYEYLTVYLKARMNDYIIDADTKQVVQGDKNREFYTNYNLKFMRSIGVVTTVNSGKSTTNCPNCGAPTQITSAGECEYCNSVITTGQHDWVLCDLDSAE
ncbi:MAG: Tim44-like domain-containing protein [Clostridia bacterium]|nr:Tim44-like domain-containing protein [Clostridia bacterium]